MNGFVERCWTATHAAARKPGQVGARSFQAWLGSCKELRRQGWDVTVLLAHDQSHAVLIACQQPSEDYCAATATGPAQLSLLAEAR